MTEQQNVKVFISWSGDLAKAVAVVLRGWLPLLFDRITPWASDTDIAAGQRGLAQIEAELKDTGFGIVVVTSSNQHAPWLNFEAGAMSKAVDGDFEQRVVPLLVDLDSAAQLTGPLAQFQAKTATKAGVLSLVQSIATVAGISDSVAAERFDAYWPRLEGAIGTAIAEDTEGEAEQPPREASDVLDEILLHVRTLVATQGPSRAEVNAAAEELRPRRTRLRDVIERIAAEHDLVVREYGPLKDGRRDVFVVARGAYSATNEEAFRKALSKITQAQILDISIPPF